MILLKWGGGITATPSPFKKKRGGVSTEGEGVAYQDPSSPKIKALKTI
jgi:hypothetical protein